MAKEKTDDALVVKETSKKYKISFKENRPYELEIGLYFHRFEPIGYQGDSDIIDKTILEHPYFNNVKHLFVVEEING